MRILQLGTLCNNACIFCAAAVERPRAAGEVDVSVIVDGETVALVGGEPTLYEPLPDLVRSARSAAGRIVVQSNGRRLAYAAYAKSLVAAGVDAFDVSLHGSTDAMHDYHTSVSGSFRQTVRGMANGVVAGMRVVVTCVVTRSNFRHLAEIVQVAKVVGASAVRFQAPRLSGRALEAQARVVAHAELVIPHLRKAVATGKRQGIDVTAGARGDADFVPFVADQASAALRGFEAVGSGSIAGRANPGRSERRVRDHRTGDELRAILPGLFDPEGRG